MAQKKRLMKRNMLRLMLGKSIKVQLVACRTTPELKEHIETKRKNHIFLKIKGASALASK